MRRSIIAFGLCLVAVSGCNREPDNEEAMADNANMTEEQTGSGTATDGSVTSVSTASFVNDLAVSDMFEIESSRLAVRKSKSADVKRFAQSMIDAHTASSAKLKEVAGAAANPTPMPTALPADKKTIMDQLNAATGEEFDRAYIDAQVSAHRQALRLLQDFSARGSDVDIRALATELVTPVSSHLDMAQTLQKSQGPASQ